MLFAHKNQSIYEQLTHNAGSRTGHFLVYLNQFPDSATFLHFLPLSLHRSGRMNHIWKYINLRL
jgi:hypothetical protein